MGCNCGGNKKKQYLVTKADGTQVVVETLSAAMQTIRTYGGRWQPVKS